MQTTSQRWKDGVRDPSVVGVARVVVTTALGQTFTFDSFSTPNTRLSSVSDEMSVDPTGASVPIDSIEVKILDYDGAFDPENPNGNYFAFVDGSRITYELGFQFYVSDGADGYVKEYELLPCGAYYLRTVEYGKNNVLTIRGESIATYLDYEFVDGKVPFDEADPWWTYRGYPLPTTQTFGSICADIFKASPVISNTYNIPVGTALGVVQPVSGKTLATPITSYWTISAAMSNQTTSLGFPRINARVALGYLATAAGATFLNDRTGRLYDTQVWSLGGFTPVADITFNEMLGEPEYTIPPKIQSAEASSKVLRVVNTGTQEPPKYNVTLNTDVYGVVRTVTLSFDEPHYFVAVLDGVFQRRSDGTSVISSMVPQVPPFVAHTINHVTFDVVPITGQESDMYEVAVSYSGEVGVGETVFIQVSNSGDHVVYDNPIIDKKAIAQSAVETIVEFMVKPTYTFDLYDDPAIDLGDKLNVQTKFTGTKPVNLIGRKRVFNGAIKSTYTVR